MQHTTKTSCICSKKCESTGLVTQYYNSVHDNKKKFTYMTALGNEGLADKAHPLLMGLDDSKAE
jgi:glycine cleavage system protein P-like pyridoxal-binding family